MYLLALLVMVYRIRWREVHADAFSLLMGVWVLIHVANWLLRGDHGGDYLHRIVQAVSIFAFVQWFRGNFDEESIAADMFLRKARIVVIAGVLVSSALAYEESFKAQLVDGFGNGRVSFSIWLVQLLFLGLLLSSKVDVAPGFRGVMWASPILVLQIFSGGRTGVVASLAICLYFSYVHGGWRCLLPTGAYLALLCAFFGFISPLSSVYPGTSKLRDIASLPVSQVFEPGGV